MDKAYNPKNSEQAMYALWEKGRYFTPKIDPSARSGQSSKKPFTIIMPPPNANGALHIGHALFVTLQDIMIRYHRMKGDNSLWLPGADHAGFETQVVFDKKLEKEGKHRGDIPEKKLIKDMLDFTLQNKQVMESQLKKLGASCDWTRNKFTLDKDIIEVVYNTFEKLKADGLIYKGSRLVNWCTKHQTSLSDLEIKYEERVDKLYYLKYPVLNKPETRIPNNEKIPNTKKSNQEYIIVATVRPETILGDTAVAVNPKDKRYQHLIGEKVSLPLVNIEIPIIADESVDMNFGTGAVKITPAHDFADYEIWQRHKDEIPTPKIVIDRYGRMNELAGPYSGMKISEAREKLVQDMIAKGLLNPAKTDHNYKHNLAVCYKCGSVIEPTLMENQWFVKMTEKPKSGGLSLRDLAIKAVKNSEVKFIPSRFEKIFLQWMENLRDWNISRQIPWGIKIPAWQCDIKNPAAKKMGFHESVVPQVLDGKTSTWRIRDHQLQVGDTVTFENSQAQEIFGFGVITKAIKTTVGAIDLKDKTHYKTYKNRQKLIEALKKHNPNKEINEKTPVFAYTYKFRKINSNDDGCGRTIIAIERPKQCPNCASENLVEESGVFDTWFSSGQWPFATLLSQGRKISNLKSQISKIKSKLNYTTEDFEYFYPTTVMETAADIIFFWVARMVMLGIYITGKAPFKYVYLHGLVRDKDKQKMSKSKGNVIDPLGVVDLHGADALRMALVFANSPGQDISFSEEKIIAQRKFANKVWNAARFVLSQMPNGGRPPESLSPVLGRSAPKQSSEADKEILNALQETAKEMTKDIDNFQFHEAAQKIYQFFWHTFCDVYIEQAKSQNEKENTIAILLFVLRESLKLLHPFMPFITEQIYQMLPNKEKDALIIENWPN